MVPGQSLHSGSFPLESGRRRLGVIGQGGVPSAVVLNWFSVAAGLLALSWAVLDRAGSEGQGV